MSSESAQRDLLVLLLPLLILSCACREQLATPPGNPQSNASTRANTYVPLFGTRVGTEREPRGSIRGDFQWALDASTLPDAAQRWQEFLTRHSPPGAEFEDGMHASYATAARYELVRVNYLLGRLAEGDALLKELDPVGWFK